MLWKIMEKNRFGEEILFPIYFIYNFKCFFFLHWHCNIGETLSVALIVVIMAYVLSIQVPQQQQSLYLLLETWYLHWWQSPDWSWLGDKTLTDHHDSHCLLMALAASFLGTIFLIWSQVPHYSRELRECDGVFSLLHLLIFPHSKSKNIPGRKYQYDNIGRAVGGEVS